MATGYANQAAGCAANAQKKVKELIAYIESIQDPSRPDKCFMCNAAYGPLANDPLRKTYNADIKRATCGHSGAGSWCHSMARASFCSHSLNELACGFSPETHACYECRRKKHPSVCLLCNQPYGGPVTIGCLTELKAKCGHTGYGYYCAQSPDPAGKDSTDISACHNQPSLTNCYACRNPAK